MQFGVIEAVNEFVEESDYSLLMMTWENYPSYILCKDLNHPKTQHFLASCLLKCNGAIDLPDYPTKMTFNHHGVNADNRTILLPTFSVKK